MDIFSVSYSKLKTFNECKIKYTFTYIYKLPVINISFSTLAGTLVHKFSELYLKGYDYKTIYSIYSNKDTFYDVVFNDLAERLRLDNDESYKERYINKLKEVNKDFIPLYTALKHFKNLIHTLNYIKKNYEKVEVEILKELTIENIKFYGILDINAEKNSNSIHILDIKTGKEKNYSKSQLLFYSVITGIEEKEISVGFINPKTNQKVLGKVDKEIIKKFKDKMLNYSIQAKEITKKIKENIPIIAPEEVKKFAVEIENNILSDENIQTIKEAITYINNNDFSKEDKKEYCNFCPYKNICKTLGVI